MVTIVTVLTLKAGVCLVVCLVEDRRKEVTIQDQSKYLRLGGQAGAAMGSLQRKIRVSADSGFSKALETLMSIISLGFHPW